MHSNFAQMVLCIIPVVKLRPCDRGGYAGSNVLFTRLQSMHAAYDANLIYSTNGSTYGRMGSKWETY